MEKYIKQRIRELAAENFNWWATYIREQLMALDK